MQTAPNPWWSIYRCIAQVLKGSPGIRARRFHLAMPKKNQTERRRIWRGWKRKNRRKTEIESLGIGRVILIGRWQKKLSCRGKELAPARKNHGAQKNFLAWKRIGGSRVRSLAVAFVGCSSPLVFTVGCRNEESLVLNVG